MASRMGARPVTANVIGIEKLDRFLREQIAAEDLNPAKKDLRQGTKKIANDVLIPALHKAADASGVPIAPAVARTARARTDRLVTVRVGATNPKLSGFRSKAKGERSKSLHSQQLRTTLAFGSDLGPHPLTKVNNYGVARRDRGYYVFTAIMASLDEAKAAYSRLIGDLLDNYGRYR